MKTRRGVAFAIAVAAVSIVFGLTVVGPSARAQPSIGIDEANKIVTVGGFTPVTGPVPFYAILTRGAEAYFR